MKKILLLVLMFGIGIIDANAQSYYINNNNIKFSKEQYDFITAMYYDGYQKYMTQDDLDYFNDVSLNINDIESNIVSDNYSRATIINTNSKTLKISKIAASNSSLITTVLTWNAKPSVNSYDVIGAFLDGVSLIGSVTTKMQNSNGNSLYSTNVNSTKGFGASVPLSGSNIKITQTFKVTNGGRVNASYQHATKNISLANSKNYTFSKYGFGGVFNFNGTASTTYDRMEGVSLTV